MNIKTKSKEMMLSTVSAINNKVKKPKTKPISLSKRIVSGIRANQAKKRRLINGKLENNGGNDISSPSSPVPSSSSTPSSSSSSYKNLDAVKCFEWLIAPVTIKTFFDEVWEEKPLHIRRQGNEYYNAILSCKDFDKMLRENHIEFTKNIDVVSYVDGVRETHSPDGRAYAPIVWDFYRNGCSVRLLNPQTYNKTIWKMNALLQEYFGSFVGANIYLTPPGSQGFAPHYDDIEAFILQLEGKKLWHVYAPRSEKEKLPRFSSENFTQDEIGPPIMELELNPGDLLYLPRGYIHQANTPPDEHSLHITLSTYQRNTWGDFLELMLPQAIRMAIDENLEFRESLPRNFMDIVGVANSDKECPERDAFFTKVIHLTKKLVKYLPIDAAADQKAKEFIHSSLPPFLYKDERNRSIHKNKEEWSETDFPKPVQFEPSTKIRLIRKRSIRLVMEDDCVRLYHTLENSRVFQERDPQFIELGAELAPAVEYLLNSFPSYVSIENLPLEKVEHKLEVTALLYDKGLLLTEEPLVTEQTENFV